jgi:phospholipid/cholesterol/gamma-HCH transport system substrate-binding protein
MSNGEVIPPSRVTTNVELQKILADLFPLLRSIRPADLSSTLYSIANALRGRGDEIGQTMVKLNDYLATMNQHLPTLQEDLALLARVSNTYSIAAPDLVRILRNATTTAHTISDKQSQLHVFFTDMTGLGRTSTAMLDANGPDIVRSGQLGVSLLSLLDKYSPEFPCLLEGAARYSKRLGTIFKGGRVRQSMTFAATQRPPYSAKDKPVYGDHRGPQCYGLPYPKVPLPGPVDFDNGTEGETAAGGNPN